MYTLHFAAEDGKHFDCSAPSLLFCLPAGIRISCATLMKNATVA